MRRHVLLATFLLTFGLPTLAHADDAATAEAQARFSEGLDLADKYKYEEARLKFLQAASVLKAPSVLFNLARTEQATGHDVEAIEHYRQFIVGSANDTRINDAMRDKAKQNITDLLRKVGQIEVDAPAGSKLSLDGKPLDETPKEPLPVTPGRHDVSATFEGRVKSVTVDAPVGTVVPAKIVFDAAPTTEPPHTESSKGRSTAGWVVPAVLAGVGVVGLATGVVFATSSQSTNDEANAMRTRGVCSDASSQGCKDYDDKRSDVESKSTVAWVGYAAGGVFLAASVATFFLWPSKKESPKQGTQTRVVPLLGTKGGGASFELTF